MLDQFFKIIGVKKQKIGVKKRTIWCKKRTIWCKKWSKKCRPKITLSHPILVYLNYRSAYQSWKDEIDRQIISVPKTPLGILPKHEKPVSVPVLPGSSSKWFLNVTVTDFKVKMPLIQREVNETIQVLLLIINHIGVSGIIGDITGFKGGFTGFQLKFATDGTEDSEGRVEKVFDKNHNFCQILSKIKKKVYQNLSEQSFYRVLDLFTKMSIFD